MSKTTMTAVLLVLTFAFAVTGYAQEIDTLLKHYRAPVLLRLSDQTYLPEVTDIGNRGKQGDTEKVPVVGRQIVLGYITYIVGFAGGGALYNRVFDLGYCELCESFFAGSIVGNLASAATVHRVGNMADYNGDFWATLAGGSVGPIGLLMASVAYHQLGTNGVSTLFFLGGAILATPLETWAYHKSDNNSSAAVTIEDSNVRLAVPRVYFRIDSFGRGGLSQNVDLLRVRF